MVGTISWLVFWAIVITRSSKAKGYTDVALTPVRDDEDETLELFTKTARRSRRRRPRQEGSRLTHAHPAT